MTGRHLAAAWALSRLFCLALLLTCAASVIGDVNYYRETLNAHGLSGIASALPEYPLAAVAVVGLPWALVQGNVQGYDWLIIGFAALTDGLFTLLLHRASRRDPVAVVAWIILVPAVGPIALCRFDLLPGALVGLTLLLQCRYPRLAALALSVATSVKLWPGLLIMPLVAKSRERKSTLVVIGAVGVAVSAVTVVLGGVGRVVSPLTYQRDRGLQIESVAATPAVAWRWLHPRVMSIWFAPSKSYEIRGPGVHTTLTATTVSSTLFVLAILFLWYKLFVKHGEAPPGETLTWVTLASATGFMVCGRVLSPQYLLWVAPAAVAGLVVAGNTRRVLLVWTGGLAAAALLTQVVFPFMYGPLVLGSGVSTGLAVTALALRNVLVVVLCAVAAWMAWRCIDAGGGQSSVGGRYAPHDRSTETEMSV